MKKLVLGLFVLASASVLAAGNPTGRVDAKAFGEGSIKFGEGLHGRGFFLFDVTEGAASATGELTFAAEDHHAYPDHVIRVTNLIRVEVSGNRAKIHAEGTDQADPVRIKVVVIDNVGTGRDDEFSIQTFPVHGDDDHGFHAHGKVFTGNLHVGPLE